MENNVESDIIDANYLSFEHPEILNFKENGERNLPLQNTSETTPLGEKYQAESDLIISQIGDLEIIRLQLGFSRRKMAELLLVDPSAWTRWTKPGARAPHSVYKALSWYFALNQKHPLTAQLPTIGIMKNHFDKQTFEKIRGDSQTFLKSQFDQQVVDLAKQRELLIHELKDLENRLGKKLKSQQQLLFVLAGFVILLLGILLKG